MSEQINKTISSLTELTSFSGNEKLPLAIGTASNAAARLSVLKEYFRDSSLVIFDEIDDSELESLSDEVLTDIDMSFRHVVYLTTRKVFAERRTYIRGGNRRFFAYSTNFNRWQDYLVEQTVNGVTKKETRQDRAFLNLEDKELYTFNGSLNNLFDSVRIVTMTEEEFNNIQHPIEGAIYGIFEEE